MMDENLNTNEKVPNNWSEKQYFIYAERPTFDEKLIEKLAIITAEIINKAKGYDDIEQSIEDAKEVLEDNWNEDGYQLAKEFEDKGYSITTMLVEELDSVSGSASDMLKEETKIWVKANNIKLEQAVGNKIIFDAWTKNNEEGEIMKLYPETAQYGVWCKSLKKPKGTSNYVINYEKIKEVIP